MTATALLAQRDPTHPLARVAARSPGLLGIIDEIATVGGGAGHANGGSVTPLLAEQHADKVYYVVSELLELNEIRSHSSSESTGGHPHG